MGIAWIGPVGSRCANARSGRRVEMIETLELRRMLSTAALRIATYNLDADTDGNTTAGPGIATVLEAIGAYAIDGRARPIDVLALQETTSNALTVRPIVDALNAYYGANTYAMSALQLTESGGDPTVGNGPSALIYNAKTVTLLQSYAVPGDLGAATGVNRQIGRYELQPLGGAAASDFYVYVDHYKSGTGTSNAMRRQLEAGVVRKDEATLPASARVIYAGDFNTNTDGEGIFTTLMGAGQGQAFDPRDPTGGVGNVDQSLASLSESATYLAYRDDYQFVTQNVLNEATGLQIVAGSEQVFGNNGTVPLHGAVTDASNTALASLANAAAVYQALTTATDHLPVIADYNDVLPTPTGSVAGTVTGAPAGETVYLDANNNGALDATELKTTTTATGAFAFGAVPIGSYVLRQVLASGYQQTTPTGNAGISVAVTAGAALTGKNFADARVATPPPTTPTRLTGTPIGTAGSINENGFTKAFDGSLATFFDSTTINGAYAGLDLGTAKTITSVKFAPRAGLARRMTGGYFQGSNEANFGGAVTLGTIQTQPADGVLTTLAFSNTTAFRYVRYVAPAGSFGNVAELQFFGTAGTTTTPPPVTTGTKLTGTAFGTAGSIGGNTFANALDGNVATYVDSTTVDHATVGLDLGSAKVIKRIAYAPRATLGRRMVGGIFQGSNSADFSVAATLFTITAAPADGVLTMVSVADATAYRYVRYVAPTGSFGNVAEVQFFA